MELLPGITIEVIADWDSLVVVVDRLKHYTLYGIDTERTHPISIDGYTASLLHHYACLYLTVLGT